MSQQMTVELAVLKSRLWTALPALVFSGAVVSVSATPVLVLGRGLSPLGLLWMGLVVSPLFGGLLSQVVDVCTGGEPATFGFARQLRLGWRSGLIAGAVPAITGSLFMISWSWWRTGQAVALVPLTASGVVTTLGLLCAIIAPAVAMVRRELRGWPLVLFCLHVVSRRPVPAVGVLACVVIIVGAAVQLSASLLVLLPVPLALVSVAAAWRTAAVSPDWPGLPAASEQPAQ